MNLSADEFTDVSGISGLDATGDGRAFAMFDYDRDGWQDLVVVNANAPFVQLFHNDIGHRTGNSTGGKVIAFRFVGANHSSSPADGQSNRDGYGAVVELWAAGRRLKREHRAGEGFAAQNSSTMLVALGDAGAADEIAVHWPSGKSQQTSTVAAGTLVTAYEDPALSPTGAPFVIEPYVEATAADSAARVPTIGGRLRVAHEVVPGPRARLILYTTMATWCVPCLGEIPDLEDLVATFGRNDLEIYGIPYDEAEEPETLTGWVDRNRPPYRILHEVGVEGAQRVKQAILERLKIDGVPAAIVTDQDGNVLLARWGPPSISELRELLEERPGH